MEQINKNSHTMGGEMKSTGLRVPSVLSFALWALITNCNATSAENSDSTAASAANPTLQEVTVTAQRREENIDRVPISIVAFSQADLDARGLKSVGDIASVTPGVDFRGVGYENWITIRGISQNAGGGVAGLGPNTTAIYVDDAPIQARYGNAAVPTAVPLVFDVDHIEVLRGPQGTLFGASAEGGAIRVISAQPSLTEFTGFARMEGSKIDNGGINSEGGAAYGGPIVQDVLGFRVSGWSRHDGGFVDNKALLFGGLNESNVNKAESYSTHAALLWKPASFVSAEASFYYQKRDQNSADLFDPTAGDPANGNFVSTRDLLQPINDSFNTPSLKLIFDLGWSQLTSVTSNLQRTDSQGYDYTTVLPPAFGFPLPTTLAQAEPTIVGTNQSNFTQEFRLQSPNSTDRFRWTAGLYYSNLHQHDFETVAAPGFAQEILQNTGKTIQQFLGENLVGGVFSYISDQYFGDKEKAVFGNAEYDIGSHFSVVGGLRYEKQDSTYLTVSDGPLVGGPSIAASTASSSIVAPKGGLNWKVDDHTLVYFSAAKGYRPGGANIAVHLTTPACTSQLAALGNTNSYEPDSLWSYEVGAKSLLFDQRLSIEGSVYHISWKNIISAVHVPACATHVAKNLGDATSDGFDLSLKALLTPYWTAGAYIGYTNAHYTTDTTLFGETLARSGQAVSDISPWNVTAELQYQAPLRAGLFGYAHVEDRYNSRNNRLVPAEDSTTDSFDPFVTTNPSVNQFDARVGLRFARGVDLSLFAINLGNAHPVLNKYLGLIDITSGAFSIPPRTVGVALLYHF
jgi:outer membrane receptor protein involved in Fe transport